jgi:probable HAF family extracellular repeat protein
MKNTLRQVIHRIRHARWARMGAILAVGTLTVTGAYAQQYTIADLGDLGGGGSEALGINDNGQIVGDSSTTPDANYNSYDHAFLYSGGVMSDLGTLPGRTDSTATGINNNGQVAGYSYTSSNDGAYHAFLWSATGGMSDLGTLGGTLSLAYGINNSGQVAGYSYTAGNTARHAFLWNASGGMTDLGTLGGTFSEAFGVNNSGHVVGAATTAGDAVHAFLYSGGVMNDLGTLGGSTSFAIGINDSGWVVGEADTADGYAAFLDVGGVMTDLNNLTPADSGWELESATAIADNGQIVGYGTNPSGDVDAFLLTPVPEPSALALLAVGTAIVCFSTRNQILKRQRELWFKLRSR